MDVGTVSTSFGECTLQAPKGTNLPFACRSLRAHRMSSRAVSYVLRRGPDRLQNEAMSTKHNSPLHSAFTDFQILRRPGDCLRLHTDYAQTVSKSPLDAMQNLVNDRSVK